MRLSNEVARKLNTPGDYTCSTTAGFFLRVGKVRKSWMVRADLYTPGERGKRRYVRNVKKVLGEFPAIDVHAARALALPLLEKIKAGIDPNARPDIETLEGAWDLNDRRLVRKQRAERTLRHQASQRQHIPKDWWSRPLSDFTRKEIVQLHIRLTDDVGPSAANGVLVALRTVFNTAIKELDLNIANPAVGIEKNEAGKTEEVRPDDVPVIFAALRGTRYFLLNRLLMLTGLRDLNARTIRKEDIKADHIVIPKTKAQRELLVPVSPEIRACLDAALAETWNGNPYLFPARGKHGFIQRNRPKHLDIRGGHGWRSLYITQAARIGVSELHIKLLVDHSIKSDITGHYMRPEQLWDSVLDAQCRISKHLDTLATSET